MVVEEQQILRDINLDIPYGKKLGIVGGTGSGKSVLLEAFIRVHDLTDGQISINGEDVKNIELESLRDKFAYVFQDVFLFSNTIDSNIAYAEPDIEKEQVIEALSRGWMKDMRRLLVREGLGYPAGRSRGYRLRGRF